MPRLYVQKMGAQRVGQVVGVELWALEFDGVDDYVTFDENHIPHNGDFTIEIWCALKNVADGTDAVVFATNDPRGIIFYSSTVLGDASNQVRFWSNSLGQLLIGNDIRGKGFVHLAVVRDGDTWHLYEGGDQIDTTTQAGDLNEATVSSMAFDLTNTDRMHEGKIASNRIWNTARTQQEIQDNMYKRLTGNEEGLVGYWPMRKGWGLVLEDRSVNNNHGIIYGADWGKVWKEPNYALEFDGINDYVNVGTMENFGGNLGQNFDIEFWIKTTTTSQECIHGVANYGITTLLQVGTNEFGSAGDIEFFIRDNTGKRLALYSAGNLVNTGAWVKVKFVKAGGNAANNITLYINDTFQPLNAFYNEGPSSFSNFEYPMAVGARNLRGILRDYFTGQIASLKIDHADGADWPMNEGSGSTVVDNSTNTNHGTIVGATWKKVW